MGCPCGQTQLHLVSWNGASARSGQHRRPTPTTVTNRTSIESLPWCMPSSRYRVGWVAGRAARVTRHHADVREYPHSTSVGRTMEALSRTLRIHGRYGKQATRSERDAELELPVGCLGKAGAGLVRCQLLELGLLAAHDHLFASLVAITITRLTLVHRKRRCRPKLSRACMILMQISGTNSRGQHEPEVLLIDSFMHLTEPTTRTQPRTLHWSFLSNAPRSSSYTYLDTFWQRDKESP